MYKYLKINYKDDKQLERLQNTVNKYMADIRPDEFTTCQSERKSVVFFYYFIIWFERLLTVRPLLAYCASLG
jgi:hypothetical protein